MDSNEQYRRAAAAGGVGVWDWNLLTGEIYVDPFLKELLGYSDSEIRNHIDDWAKLVHPEDVSEVTARANAHIAGEVPFYEVEHRMLHRNGSIRWFLARGCVTRDAVGTPIRMVGTDSDITDRKRSEEALGQVQEINTRIVESIGDCLMLLSLFGGVLYVNPEGVRLFQLCGFGNLGDMQFTDIWQGDSRQDAEEAVMRARGGDRGRFQASLKTTFGTTKWLDVVVTPIFDVHGKVVQLLSLSRDISEKRREEAFREGQHRVLEMIAMRAALPDTLRALVELVEQQTDGMLCSVLLLDDDGVSVRHGAAPNLPEAYIRAIDGSTIGPRAGSCGTAMYLAAPVIVEDIMADPLWEAYRDVARSFGLRACWSTPILSSGRTVLGSFAMYYGQVRYPSHDELRLIETAADIAGIAIEHHRAQQALRRSEARNDAILRAIPDWMFVITAEGMFLDYHAKEPAKLFMPPTRFLGRRIREVFPPPVADAFERAADRARLSGETEKLEFVLGPMERERYYEACVVRCDTDKILTIVRDISDRKQAELEAGLQRSELAHLGRVAMLGELSGALAHELSQPLAAILTNAQAARRFLEQTPLDLPELRATLDDVIKNDKRAGAVIDRLRALLKKGDADLQPLDLNDVAKEVLDLTNSDLIGRRMPVTVKLAGAIPQVLGDRVQLQQVVLNLVLNACDAMTDVDPGERRLTLETGVEDGFVQLAVSDRGVGIPASQLDVVFEPFVTFRDTGLGLGLAISRSIVTAHQGHIQAENNPDRGATFRCFLPALTSSYR
jgi:PAS domain S-box-containing protein